jgi:hypothetical protein
MTCHLRVVTSRSGFEIRNSVEFGFAIRIDRITNPNSTGEADCKSASTVFIYIISDCKYCKSEVTKFQIANIANPERQKNIFHQQKQTIRKKIFGRKNHLCLIDDR